MSRLRATWRRLIGVFGRTRSQADFDEELDSHLRMHVEDGVRAGMTPDEARRAALVRFGGVEAAREAWRDRRGLPFIDTTMRDIASAFRTLRRGRARSAVAILSLALGIGATTAIFTIVDALMIERLPVDAPERLVQVSTRGDYGLVSNPLWETLRDYAPIFESALATAYVTVDVTVDADTRPVDGVFVSGGYFRALGVDALEGRTFSPADDDVSGGPGGPVAMLTYRFWQTRFEGSRDAIGRAIGVNGHPFTIVGVTPPRFQGVEVGRSPDVFIPLGMEAILRGSESALHDPYSGWLRVLARLPRGVTPPAAQAALEGNRARLRADLRAIAPRAESLDAGRGPVFRLESASAGISYLRDQYRSALLTLMVLVALVLVAACTNIANLLLAQGAARQREMAVRLALGATRARLVRQLLTEDLCLAAAGSGLGLVLAHWASRAIVRQLSTSAAPIVLNLGLDSRVLAFTALVTVATVMLFGLVPALRASATRPGDAMKGTSAVTRARLVRPGVALVGVQIAISLTLVTGAGLFVRTFINLLDAPKGFDTSNVLVAAVNLRRAGPPPAARGPLYARALQAARETAGVRAAASAINVPINGWSLQTAVWPDDRGSAGEGVHVFANQVSADYFRVLSTPLLAGRSFDVRDTPGAPPVAMVNETFARLVFRGADPIGRSFVDEDGGHAAVIGVVADATYSSLRESAPPTVYLAMSQATSWRPSFDIIAKSADNSGETAARLRRALAQADADFSVSVGPLQQHVADSMARERVLAWLTTFLGALGLLLAAVGLYGVLSQILAQRRREMGIRLALGGRPRDVVRALARHLVLSVCLGLAVGVVISLGASRLVGVLLFGVAPDDPRVLALAVCILLIVAGAAATAPILRAIHLNPIDVLRDE
jgi:predicted permease